MDVRARNGPDQWPLAPYYSLVALDILSLLSRYSRCSFSKQSIMGFAENALSLVTVTNVFLGLVAYVVFKFVSQIVHYRFFHPLKAFAVLSGHP